LEVGIYNSLFAENLSSSGGGAAYLTGTINIEQNQFLKNIASTGGAVFLDRVFGQLASSSFASNSAGFGGAITIRGASPLLNRVTINKNQARNCGGGVYLSSGGTTTIRKSIIAENEVENGNGGGICLNDGGLLVNSTTLTKNRAVDGGGIGQETISNEISIILLNSTISANIATGIGGAIAMKSSTYAFARIDLQSAYTTYFGNQAVDSNTNQVSAPVAQLRGNIFVTSEGKNCSIQKISSTGFNISSDDSCDFSSRGDLKNTDPKLAPLADNGSGILTHMPMLGSPVLDAIPLNTCEARDARDITRPQGSACDIGAVERSASDK
jgi:hypothetical protein